MEDMVTAYSALQKLVLISLVNKGLLEVTQRLTLPSIARGHSNIANISRLNNVMKRFHLIKNWINWLDKTRMVSHRFLNGGLRIETMT